MCACWVPRSLTNYHKNVQIEVCSDSLSHYEGDGESFLSQIINGYETWLHHFELQTKKIVSGMASSNFSSEEELWLPLQHDVSSLQNLYGRKRLKKSAKKLRIFVVLDYGFLRDVIPYSLKNRQQYFRGTWSIFMAEDKLWWWQYRFLQKVGNYLTNWMPWYPEERKKLNQDS